MPERTSWHVDGIGHGLEDRRDGVANVHAIGVVASQVATPLRPDQSL